MPSHVWSKATKDTNASKKEQKISRDEMLWKQIKPEDADESLKQNSSTSSEARFEGDALNREQRRSQMKKIVLMIGSSSLGSSSSNPCQVP
ncbi:hypothetical protein PoB_006105500 [Plakobranchus ocellatus]|uniref:Uncharacterized protein n=1 Tax=Plakobranchus ocellatus TaxID=259542 RepID=A0AAV4CRT9_9GAST|nr:hypothetical protein PoB_006105500 [Plakobranchus ocellatus]